MKKKASTLLYDDVYPIYVTVNQQGCDLMAESRRIGLPMDRLSEEANEETMNWMSIMAMAELAVNHEYLRFKHLEDANTVYGIIVEHMKNMSEAAEDPYVNHNLPVKELAILDQFAAKLVEMYSRDIKYVVHKEAKDKDQPTEEPEFTFVNSRAGVEKNGVDERVNKTIKHDSHYFRKIISSTRGMGL